MNELAERKEMKHGRSKGKMNELAERKEMNHGQSKGKKKNERASRKERNEPWMIERKKKKNG